MIAAAEAQAAELQRAMTDAQAIADDREQLLARAAEGDAEADKTLADKVQAAEVPRAPVETTQQVISPWRVSSASDTNERLADAAARLLDAESRVQDAVEVRDEAVTEAARSESESDSGSGSDVEQLAAEQGRRQEAWRRRRSSASKAMAEANAAREACQQHADAAARAEQMLAAREVRVAELQETLSKISA
uniref:Uncharacterized protein n=1 Tax=Prasinoderma singulare TaxID=676789 RepID=A0A7S3BCJ1_9VIRI